MSLLDAYDYRLPPELIAHAPAEPRDSARLFVYDTATDQVSLCHVRDLPTLLSGSLVLYNDTKVLPARLACHHEGQPIELLILVDQGMTDDGLVRALVNRRVRVKEQILAPEGSFIVIEDHEKSMLLRYTGTVFDLHEMLDRAGHTPLPPYISSTASETEKRAQYQTIFATGEPSVAAPTASLHFTDTVVQDLLGAGVTMAPITLQVGLGTFASIFDENMLTGTLHREWYTIPGATAHRIKHARAHARPIVAVGTTCVRTLESAKDALDKGEGAAGMTDLFIRPPHRFTYPDTLMTNFHVPRSSLLCLVQAFLEHKSARRSIIDLYQIAIAESFRFYSFGDAMLIR